MFFIDVIICFSLVSSELDLYGVAKNDEFEKILKNNFFGNI